MQTDHRQNIHLEVLRFSQHDCGQSHKLLVGDLFAKYVDILRLLLNQESML